LGFPLEVVLEPLDHILRDGLDLNGSEKVVKVPGTSVYGPGLPSHDVAEERGIPLIIRHQAVNVGQQLNFPLGPKHSRHAELLIIEKLIAGQDDIEIFPEAEAPVVDIQVKAVPYLNFQARTMTFIP